MTWKMVFNQLFPRLKERRSSGWHPVRGGEQQMLSAITRALMSHPKLMMLDELPPWAWLLNYVDQVFGIVMSPQSGTTILLVEQNAVVKGPAGSPTAPMSWKNRLHHPGGHRPRAGQVRRGPQGLPRAADRYPFSIYKAYTPLHRPCGGVFCVCRKRQLHGCCMMALGWVSCWGPVSARPFCASSPG